MSKILTIVICILFVKGCANTKPIEPKEQKPSCFTEFSSLPKYSLSDEKATTLMASYWRYSEVGKDYKETEKCSYYKSGAFFCDVEESGCSEDGFCDAHSHREAGIWRVQNGYLLGKVQLTYTKEVSEFKYKIISLTEDYLYLDKPINNKYYKGEFCE